MLEEREREEEKREGRGGGGGERGKQLDKLAITVNLLVLRNTCVVYGDK